MPKMRLFPADKPKSWVVSMFALLSAVFVMPLGTIAFTWHVMAAVLLSATVGIVAMLVYLIRLFSGRYRDLEPRSWKEQVW